MDEDALNQSVRKFLKQLGVTGQREIEKAVREAVDEGRISDGDDLAVKATIRIDALGLEHTVDGTLKTE